MRSAENFVARVEQTLNPIDWFPFIASFSGMVRILAGAVQVAVGVVFALLKMIYNLVTGEGSSLREIKRGYIYSLHGIGNITRGCLAMLPGLNLLLFVHDRYLGRMNYEQEEMQRGVYPLMTAHRLVARY